MGRGKSADATDFWTRYEVLASREKDFAVSVAAKIRPSTLSSYKSEKRFPRANEALAIARALGTTVEFLVTGREPLLVSPAELPLLERARRFPAVLADLDLLEESVRAPWIAGIRAAAAAAPRPSPAADAPESPEELAARMDAAAERGRARAFSPGINEAFRKAAERRGAEREPKESGEDA